MVSTQNQLEFIFFFFNYHYFSCRYALVLFKPKVWFQLTLTELVLTFHMWSFSISSRNYLVIFLFLSLHHHFGFNSTVIFWCGESGFRYHSCPEPYRSWRKRGLRSFNHREKTPGCYHWDSVTANTITPQTEWRLCALGVVKKMKNKREIKRKKSRSFVLSIFKKWRWKQFDSSL